MPVYDRICRQCGHKMFDCYEKIETPPVPCEKCGTVTERALLSKPSAVIGDDIPGGIEIRHGLCWPDGTPRRFYSNSEITRAAREKGLTNVVEHVPTNQGTDKSRHTTRWY